MKDKKLLLIVLILVLFVSIGKETYALFTSEVSSVVQSYGTGTLKLSYSSTVININNAYPMSNEEGMNTGSGIITITNTGTLAYKFDVKIDISSGSTLSSDLIKVSVDEQSPALLSLDGNVIIRDIVLNPGSSRSFALKLWIDSKAASSDVLGKKFVGNLTSSGIAVKNMDDSVGTVLNGSVYNYIKSKADTTTTIYFSQTSEQDNTNGIYMTTNTDSGSSVYYYRGDVDNHLIFANFCWRIIRTTETGGVKLIYDGKPSNGQCNNTGSNSTIGSSAFNSTRDDNAYVGYMYGTARSSTYASTHVNTNDSTIKGVIDTWYQNNMTSYTSQLEDTVWCNDRSIVTDSTILNGSSYTTLGYGTNKTLYGPGPRVEVDVPNPTLKCAQDNDRFTVDASNGNGALTYPVGLITADEMVYAGGKFYGSSSNANSSFYLYTGQFFWALSPSSFSSSRASEFVLRSAGALNGLSVSSSFGVRPSVSLQPGIAITGGTGTATDPFVVG